MPSGDALPGLERLLGSLPSMRILLSLESGKRHSAYEIASLSGVQANEVRRVARVLCSMGIVQASTTGDRKVYQLERWHPIWLRLSKLIAHAALMPPEHRLQVLKGLCRQSRARILLRLNDKQGRMTSSQLTRTTAMDKREVRATLADLLGAGVVRRSRSRGGRAFEYRINRSHAIGLLLNQLRTSAVAVAPPSEGRNKIFPAAFHVELQTDADRLSIARAVRFKIIPAHDPDQLVKKDQVSSLKWKRRIVFRGTLMWVAEAGIPRLRAMMGEAD